MNLKWLYLAFLFPMHNAIAQGPYAPAADTPGTTAISADSNVFVHWAEYCSLDRGWINIADTALGLATVGSEGSCIGHAGENGLVSLGDAGIALLSFEGLLFNGDGPDFAVFENSFSDYYLELAHVEVSSDGDNFFRFPSVSLTQADSQIGAFGLLDPTNLNNLAGKYRALYGTPFDLDELVGIDGLDVNAISHIRIIDVVGSIGENGSNDSEGYLINDPFPTEFESSGFDLDAVGLINWSLQLNIVDHSKPTMNFYPNPFQAYLSMNLNEGDQIEILDSTGRIIMRFANYFEGLVQLNTEDWKVGLYIISVNQSDYYQLIKTI